MTSLVALQRSGCGKNSQNIFCYLCEQQSSFSLSPCQFLKWTQWCERRSYWYGKSLFLFLYESLLVLSSVLWFSFQSLPSCYLSPTLSHHCFQSQFNLWWLVDSIILFHPFSPLIHLELCSSFWFLFKSPYTCIFLTSLLNSG